MFEIPPHALQRIVLLLESDDAADVDAALKTIWFENIDALRSEDDGRTYQQIIDWLIEQTGGYRVAHRFEERCYKWLPWKVKRAILDIPVEDTLITRARNEPPFDVTTTSRDEDERVAGDPAGGRKSVLGKVLELWKRRI